VFRNDHLAARGVAALDVNAITDSRRLTSVVWLLPGADVAGPGPASIWDLFPPGAGRVVWWAVVVGVLVGGAVRKGSNGRGGWRYQLLAMFLTYTAVVVTDSSLIARELKKEWGAQAASSAAVADGINASSDAAPSTSHRPGPLAVVLGLMLIIALAYAAPIMIGITSPLHLLIAGFALYEAWKLNRGVALHVTGPYQAAARPAAA